MLSRYVTSIVSNLLRSPSQWKIGSQQFHGTSLMHQKEKKNARLYSKRKEPEGPKIIKPGNCADSPKPILDPSCKVAIIVSGSNGFGFAAADHLLCKGARNIVMVDNDLDQGHMAAKRLCDSYGKDRVQFLGCNLRNHCQFEAALKQAACKHKTIHILFNDFDKEWFSPDCGASEKKENDTARAIRVGLNIMGKNNGGSGGIIVNCASIFGFMGWPQDPFPIYCNKEPIIEITMDFANEFKVEETGVRIVALCPTNKDFCDIGLPDFPDSIPNKYIDKLPLCIPTAKYQVGSALSHVLARAESGTTWLVEPAVSVREIPRLIHFPLNEGEKVDPKVYETQPCTVKLEPPCVKASASCPLNADKSCTVNPPKKK